MGQEIRTIDDLKPYVGTYVTVTTIPCDNRATRLDTFLMTRATPINYNGCIGAEVCTKFKITSKDNERPYRPDYGRILYLLDEYHHTDTQHKGDTMYIRNTTPHENKAMRDLHRPYRFKMHRMRIYNGIKVNQNLHGVLQQLPTAFEL